MMFIFVYLLASLAVLTYLTLTSSADPTEEGGDKLAEDIVSWTLLSLAMPLYLVLVIIVKLIESIEKLIFGAKHAE
jgi:hypothetical protein